MKHILITLGLLFALLLAACSPTFPLVQDTRSATATNTPWIVGPVNDTPTPVAVVTATPAATPICLIKGNINTKGEKHYFTPGQANYVRTIVDPSKGERWFCTAEEAEAAGWTHAVR